LLLLCALGCSKQSTPANQPKAKGQTGTSVIRGTIHFNGQPPAPQSIDAAQDTNCPTGLTSESIKVNDGQLKNVFLYIKEGLPDADYPAPAPATLDQRGCRYIPHVLGLMTGQKLQILNSDPTMHNVHPSSRTNKSWNLSQDQHAPPEEKSFSKPELLMPVQCNVHPWMKMYVNVVPHPFFAVSGDDGGFEIRNLPAGTYTIAALHEKLGEKTAKITVRDGEAANVELTFSLSDQK
jgi:hypothetical protein